MRDTARWVGSLGGGVGWWLSWPFGREEHAPPTLQAESAVMEIKALMEVQTRGYGICLSCFESPAVAVGLWNQKLHQNLYWKVSYLRHSGGGAWFGRASLIGLAITSAVLMYKRAYRPNH